MMTIKRNHKQADFEFIGRGPSFITTEQDGMNVAGIIRNTGLPNYRAARICLKSDLNIGAYERHLQDYPDICLNQYPLY